MCASSTSSVGASRCGATYGRTGTWQTIRREREATQMTSASAATEAAAKLGLPLPTLEWILPTQVTYDPRVQRPEELGKLADITDNFEPAAINVVSMSRRKNGTL